MADNEEEFHTASGEELEPLRDTLPVGASEAQALMLQEAERFLTPQDIAHLRGDGGCPCSALDPGIIEAATRRLECAGDPLAWPRRYRNWLQSRLGFLPSSFRRAGDL